MSPRAGSPRNQRRPVLAVARVKTLADFIAPRHLAPRQAIAEKYRGIRPAPGYPAQPDHAEKAVLFELLGGGGAGGAGGTAAAGVTLTESFAMWPGASVCGLYFSHPESYYFGVGKIERDQVEDYARRKGWSAQEAERWLRSMPA